MKITNSSSYNQIYKTNSKLQIKGNGESDNIKSQPEKQCPSQTLQAYNNISFSGKGILPIYYIEIDKSRKPQSILTKISYGEDESIKVRFGSEIITEYLSDENGDIEEERIRFFLKAYQDFLQKITDKNRKNAEFLASITQGRQGKPKESNIIYLNPEDEIRSSFLSSLSRHDEEDIVTSFFNGINDSDLRRKLAVGMKDAVSFDMETMKEIALSRTKKLMDLSKINGDYDLSDIELKEEMAEHIESLLSNFGTNIDIDEYIACSRKDDGTIDFNFAKKLFQLISYSEVFQPDKLVTHRCNILKSFMKTDAENSAKISSSIVDLASVYHIDDADFAFENIFMQSFNPQTCKFDEKAFQTLMELIPHILDATEDFSINSSEDLEEYKNTQVNLAKAYFYEIRNPRTGEINEKHLTPKEFLQRF